MKSSYPTGRRAEGGLRKPYRKPKTLSREKLEALAVDCGGTGKTDEYSCNIGPIQS